MKKMNFTKPRLVKNWLMIVAFLFASFSVSQLNAQCQLNADDHVHVILSDDNCDAMLMQEMFLSDDGAKCAIADHYEFEVRSEDGLTVLAAMAENVVLDETFIGGPYMLIIQAHDAAHTILNTAMLTFDVADKMPPVITCPPAAVEIQCWQQDNFTLTSNDNCSVANVIVTNEVITDNDCSTGLGGLNWAPTIFRQIERTFVAVDASGNQSAPCTVTLQVNRLTDLEFFTMIQFPDDLVKAKGSAIACIDADSMKDVNGVFDPNKTGWPFLVFPDENLTAAEILAGNLTDTMLLNNDCSPACNLASTFVDVKVNTCPECIEKVVRFWTVVESSCQYPERFRPNIQTIEVVDDIDPVVVCPDDIVITTNTIADFPPSTSGDLDCGAMFTFPTPEMSDECHSHLTWTISVVNDMATPIMFADTAETKTPVSRALPLGVNTVTYTVYDNCGNKTQCSWIVDVRDYTAPVAVCKTYTTVSLTYDGEAQIFAPSFDSGSYDDCTIDHFGVRRMDRRLDCQGNYDPVDDVTFRDHVTFCCDDIANNDITVIMRVWDKGGRWNDCMVQVTVQDKLPPQITCPPSLCVECDYPFVIENMGDYFGTVVQGYENRETNTINGEYGSLYDTFYDECEKPSLNFNFKDGWSRDNCALEMTSSYEDKRDQCNNGNIVRTYTVTDPNGSATCTQTVHFYNPEPFDKDDISWPKDVNMNECSNESNYGPDVTGWPVLTEDNCDLVAANYKDDVFHFNDDEFDAEGVCFKVIRHWTVMDWCQRYPTDHADPALAGKFYTWGWDQVIMISETNDPVFTTDCEDKETCTYDTECKDGYIELSMSAEDECTTDDNLKWRFKVYSFNSATDKYDVLIKDSKTTANPIISGNTASASGEYPIGKHRIVWTVWDQCGNRAVCDKFFTIKNCKKPTPRCINHVVIEMMPLDQGTDGIADWAMIDVDANLVEACCAKSSHPCGYELKYSFSADTNDVSRTYYCGNDNPKAGWYSVDPTVGVLEPIQMWVTAILPDGTVTQDYCVTNIDFQDNNEACKQASGTVSVSGMITTTLNDPIENVKVQLQGSEETPQNTSNNGSFEFEVGSNKNYSLKLDKDSRDLDGITTLDIVLIQKHLLGIKKLDNPYKLLAANVNDDTKLTASDILVLRKLILGSIDDLGDAWFFLPKDHIFANPSKPLAQNLPTSTLVNTTDDVIMNYYGVKMGDVNMSLNVLETRSADQLVLSIDNANIQIGQIEVPVYANDFSNIEGFQYTVQFDSKVMEFEGIESGIISINNSNLGTSNISNGKLAMSWDKVGVVNTNNEMPIFTLKFNAINTANLKDVININSSITNKEAYNSNLEVMNVELEYRNLSVEAFELYQNTPNPFSTHTDISFNLPENSNGTISIYDLTGKVLKVISNDFEKGMNTVRVKKSDLNVSGVLYYRLQTEGFTATKKMILIK